MPMPAIHSSSDGHGRSSAPNAYRAELRMSSIESIRVPSRSNRIVGERRVAGIAFNVGRRYHAAHGFAQPRQHESNEETAADTRRVSGGARRRHDRRLLRVPRARPTSEDAADVRGGVGRADFDRRVDDHETYSPGAGPTLSAGDPAVSAALW